MEKDIQLKNTILCRLFFYQNELLSVLLGTAVLGLCLYLGGTPLYAGLIAWFASLGYALFLLFGHLDSARRVEAVLQTVEAWKKDRTFFEVKTNGRSRQEAERAVLNRASRWGEEVIFGKSWCSPMGIFHRETRLPWQNQTVILYSVSRLDGEVYRKLTMDAVYRAAQIHTEHQFGFSLEGVPAYSGAVIILADVVTEEVKELVRRPISSARGTWVACVGSCKEGRYWMDGRRDIAIPGEPFQPEKNQSIALAAKIGLGGARLSFGGIQPAFEPMTVGFGSLTPTSTYGEMLYATQTAGTIPGRRGAGSAAEISSRMENGQVLEENFHLYFRMGDKLACWDLFQEEERSPNWIVVPTGRWLLPKMQRITAEENDEIRYHISRHLRNSGRNTVFLDEN